jgi:phenylalanyl-tRNA synthetase beta subunit
MKHEIGHNAKHLSRRAVLLASTSPYPAISKDLALLIDIRSIEIPINKVLIDF